MDSTSLICMAGVAERTEIVADPLAVKNWSARRWESAETHRLNRAHWSRAQGSTINEDLYRDLETLRNRCDYERANNPMVDGVIWTHEIDVVGPNGPTLRVMSSNEEFNKAAELIWKKWFRRPTLHPRRSGASILRLWVGNLWTKGEYLAQKVTDRNAAGPVKMRLNPIHPNRLGTPLGMTADPNVIMGVRSSAEGVPQQYFIADQQPMGVFTSASYKYTPVPADLIVHNFLQVEEGQVRGFPWLSSSLDEIAHGRDYDGHVLEAAKNHAAQSVFLFTRHPESQYIEVNETTPLERGMASTCPPGWEPFVTSPTQPGTQYVDYKRELQRHIGRPVSMPLMAIRLDSSEHNYSSARFDGQVYLRALRTIQNWLSAETLDELVDEILLEAELGGELSKRPDDIRYQWIWPVPPHVDPLKEAKAERELMENGTLPYSDAVASHGRDPDEVIEQRKTDNERLTAAGLPMVPVPKESLPPDEGGDDNQDQLASIEDKLAGKK